HRQISPTSWHCPYSANRKTKTEHCVITTRSRSYERLFVEGESNMDFAESFFKEEMRSGFLVSEKRKKIWAIELRMLEKLDDDIDVVMFREDYEKFQTVAPVEFTEPYFFQNSYTDQMLWFFSKIRDSRTTAIEFAARNLHQGIFIDIFPFDDVPDGIHEEFDTVLEVQREIKRASEAVIT
ncbi:MAG: LicD family protein, partial [Roseburia sp.]|nr:LicD family protein [Roseburia sp.]